MRHMSFLIPVVLVCGLTAFLIPRAFDTSSSASPERASDRAGAVAARAVVPLPLPAPPGPSAGDAPTMASPPTASAPRAPVPAADVRHELERRLRDSGPAPEAWAGELGGAVHDVLRAPELVAALRNAPEVECFAEGCMATLVFASDTDFDLHQPAIGEAAALERWSRVVTGPERQADGTVRNALVVFRPHTRDELAAIEARRAELHATAP